MVLFNVVSSSSGNSILTSFVRFFLAVVAGGTVASCYRVGVRLLSHDFVTVPADRPWKSERRRLENHTLVWPQFSTTLLSFCVYR